MAKHFELTEESREYEGRTVYRIRALVDLPRHNVKAGDLGGFAQGAHNLRDEAWVADEAIVCDEAILYGNALAKDNAVLEGQASMSLGATISDYGIMFDRSKLSGGAQVKEMARMGGDAYAFGEATISGSAYLTDLSSTCGYATVTEYAAMSGKSKAFGNSYIDGCANMKDHAAAFGDAHVSGLAYLDGNTRVGDGAVVTRPIDTMTIYPLGDDLVSITIAPTKNGAMVYSGTDIVPIELGELEEFLRLEVESTEEVIEASVALFNAKAKTLKQSQ